MSFRSIVRDVRDSFGSLSRRSFEVRLSSHDRGKSQGSVYELHDELPIVQQSRWAGLPPELLCDVIKRLEASESTWPSRKHVVACAAVCRSWREMCKEIVRSPEFCGKITFPVSLKQPGSRDGTIQCFIKRDKSKLTYHLYLCLSPAVLVENGKFLLAAKRNRRTTCTEYVISMDADNISRSTYLGFPPRVFFLISMPPKSAKSKEAVTERPILGRFSSHLKIGIVGLPNVGKSTLFNTLTKLSIPAENFPFCTIDPNEARINVPDERFDWLCQLHKPKSEVSAFLEIHDIAGLVRGAHLGQGLGNSFLSHIRAVDGIFHVLRAFEDPDIIHVDDAVDPVRDLETITEELRLKDIEFMERKLDDLEKSMKRSNDKQLKIEHECCHRVIAWLKDGKDIRLGDWKTADVEILNALQLLTAKPVVYLVNMNEKDYQRKKNKFLPKIHAWVQEHGGEPIIPFSCILEKTLADMPEDEAAKYCKENNVQSVIPKIIKTGFAAINLIYFFTAGPDEVKCWQIRRQTKAPQAAGAIHTDFERGFICAEVMKFDDLKELGSESAAKAAGKYRQEGKMYVVQDGDVIFFKFNVSGGGKK